MGKPDLGVNRFNVGDSRVPYWNLKEKANLRSGAANLADFTVVSLLLTESSASAAAPSSHKAASHATGLVCECSHGYTILLKARGDRHGHIVHSLLLLLVVVGCRRIQRGIIT